MDGAKDIFTLRKGEISMIRLAGIVLGACLAFLDDFLF
jgi:hypothetical protein